MINDADGAVVRGKSRRSRRLRAWSGSNNLGSGFNLFETAQGPGVVSVPIECYKFEIGATVYRYTSADRNFTLAQVDVGTYVPTVVDRDAIDFTQEDTAQNIGVRLLQTDPVAQLFIAFNSVSPVSLTIIRKHRADAEEVIIFVGKVVTVSFDGPQATLTCAPISEVFRRRIPGPVFQSLCNWALYGAGCGVDKNLFNEVRTITAIAQATITCSTIEQLSGWYSNGWAELANGDRRFIIDHVGNTITLQSPFPSSLAVGATITLFAGCDRTEATCVSKFNNLVNHLGFPRVPTRNPYDGSIV